MYPIEHNGPGFKYRVGIRKDGKTNITEISDWNENIKEVDFGLIYEPFEVFVEAVNDKGVPDAPALIYRAYTGESGEFFIIIQHQIAVIHGMYRTRKVLEMLQTL